jgi:hypothetical protein
MNECTDYLKADNRHFVMSLSQEFDCFELRERAETFIMERPDIGDLIKKLEDVEQAEDKSFYEGLLASDVNVCIERLMQFPSSKLPVSCLHRILERGLSDVSKKVNQELLCEFIVKQLEERPELLLHFLDFREMTPAQRTNSKVCTTSN